MSEQLKDVEEMDDTMSSKHSPKESRSPLLSEEEHEEPPAFSLAMLGLQRVGTAPKPKSQPAQPLQLLNARGMPARIRKRNRFFFDENIVNDDKPLRVSFSPRKVALKRTLPARKTPTKLMKKRKSAMTSFLPADEMKDNATAEVTVDTSSGDVGVGATTKSGSIDVAEGSQALTSSMLIPVDQTMAQQVGFRLRNLLKLPKAHKWVLHEWFYSFIDKPLFGGVNDFQICLAESFPNLRTRQLTRAEWRQIRALLGKPRRCSPAFFEQARRELECKRQMIRYLQTRKSGDVKDLNLIREMPDKIPLPLPAGTKVTARLHMPQDGIFSGTVDAFDLQASTYRVTFERAGLGIQSVPDIEIVSENFHEMLPLQSLRKVFRPNPMSVFNKTPERDAMDGLQGVRSALKMNLNKSDPLLEREDGGRTTVIQGEKLNGYPVKLLETMVRMKRAIAIKRSKLQRLSDMNDKAEIRAIERTRTHNSSSDESPPDESPLFSEDFQRRYASIVISLEKMNRDMQDYLNKLQTFSTDLTGDPLMQTMMTPCYLREKCREVAEDAVEKKRRKQSALEKKQDGVEDKKMVQLIKGLTTVLNVASHLENDGNSAHVSKVLEGCIEEVKSSLHPENIETFRNHVQVHLDQIRKIFGQTSLPTATTTAIVPVSSSSLMLGSSWKPDAAASSSSWMPGVAATINTSLLGAAAGSSSSLLDASSSSWVPDAAASISSSMLGAAVSSSSWIPGMVTSSSTWMPGAAAKSSSWMPGIVSSSSSWTPGAAAAAAAAATINSSLLNVAASSSPWMPGATPSVSSAMVGATASNSPWMPDAATSTSSWTPDAAAAAAAAAAAVTTSSWMLDVAASSSSWMLDAASSSTTWMPGADEE